jgi:hypothetical protein
LPSGLRQSRRAWAQLVQFYLLKSQKFNVEAFLVPHHDAVSDNESYVKELFGAGI